jgi:proline dehydrogenase
VKLTQMGLDIDRELCVDNMRRILDRASKLDIFVRIDMEGSPHTELTIGVFEELAEEYDNVGLVVQAYLYRTEEDLERLDKYNTDLRLCKGAYLEPPDIAFPSKEEVDRSFRKLIAQHLHNGNYTAVATHDEDIIAFTIKYVEDHDIPDDLFEFQMLYGIRRDLQQELADEGYTVRVYVPFGTEWYPYFTRRLAERPANVFFIMQNLFKG